MSVGGAAIRDVIQSPTRVSEKDLPSAHWRVTDNRLLLTGQDGVILHPTALDVYGAAFADNRIVAGHAVASPVGELPEIRFSKVPALPAVRLQGGGLAELRAEVGVCVGGIFGVVDSGVDHVILGGTWYPVRSEDTAELSAWLESLGVSPANALDLGTLIRLRQTRSTSFRVIDEVELRFADAGSLPEVDVRSLRATLYPYQAIGASFLRMISAQGIGCLLADEMGLGKTLQIITLLHAEHAAERGPSLVVAPATLLENWRREIVAFAPALRVLVHAGRERAGVPAVLQSFNVVVTSYDAVVRDEQLLAKVSWNILVLDEAQNIKNPVAQRTASVKRLARRVSVAVTGTPVENRLEDLWSLSDFCLPGLLGDLSEFRQGYGDTREDATALGRVIRPVILRRRVAEVARDLPEVVEIPQAIAMSQRLAETYEEVRTSAANSASPGLAVLMPLRQIAAHPSLIRDWPADPSEDVPKYERLLQLLDEAFAMEQKVLVFAGFHSLLQLMRSDLADRWPSGFFALIDGETPIDDRQLLVDRFSTFAGFGALLLNPKAAGTGLNITAANHVIHYTPEWNPAVTAQASARAHRRGQRLPVTVHHLFYADSVEEVMIERAALKREIAAAAATGHTGDASPSDILAALRRSPLANTGR